VQCRPIIKITARTMIRIIEHEHKEKTVIGEISWSGEGERKDRVLESEKNQNMVYIYYIHAYIHMKIA
jgi:hypothetical protein